MNTTPRSIRPLELSASRALEGVRLLAALLGLKAHDFTTLATVVYDLFGRPADPAATPPLPAIPGKQPLYLEAKAEHTRARAAFRTAMEEGRAFMMQAVNTLKGLLGNRWNGQWEVLGFTAGSLQLPRNPVSFLTLLGVYYRRHGEHSVPSLDLTSERAEQVKAAILRALAAADAAKAAERAAKQARDAAFVQLRMRIRGLREELRCLLRPDDSRWYSFGFRRPVDGNTPEAIDELTLRPGAAGEVIAEWPPARLADNYRVSWNVAESSAEPTSIGLVADRQTIISDVPTGTTITVLVTARNGAGESVPTTADILVPSLSTETALSASISSAPLPQPEAGRDRSEGDS